MKRIDGYMFRSNVWIYVPSVSIPVRKRPPPHCGEKPCCPHGESDHCGCGCQSCSHARLLGMGPEMAKAHS